MLKSWSLFQARFQLQNADACCFFSTKGLSVKIDERVLKAVKLQEQGEMCEAEAIFQKVIASNPDDFVSLYSLGVIAFRKNDYQAALSLFDEAKKRNSCFAPLWFNAGVVLGRLGRIDESIASFDQAIQLDPTYAAAIKQRDNLTAALRQQNNPAALEVEQRNGYADKLRQAVELQGCGKLDEAEKLFLEILSVDGNDIPSLYSLGALEQARNNPDRALNYIERGLVVRPDYAPFWYSRGVMLQSQKKHDEAIESYDKALSLKPTYVEAMINRGAVLVEVKRHKEALVNYEELLKVDPNNCKALCNRGIILTDFKLYELAIQTYERLLRVSPDFDYALGLLCFAKLHACNWEKLDTYYPRILAGIQAGKRVCKSQALLAISNEPRDHLLCAQIFADQHYPQQEPLWKGETYEHRKIRIAYVSPDFREHPVGYLTTGIFENHDRERFETIAISLGIDDNSRIRERMVAAFDTFIDVRQMSSRSVAELLRSMEVDIVVDLAGYTADSRTDIFSYRPAPIQVNFLGYSSTMGVRYIDYIIADRFVIPEDAKDCYSEKVVYMPDSYLPTDSSVRISERMLLREEYGLPATGVVFCSFNHDYKINPPVFDVWMRLLRQIPGSVLWLMKLNEAAERNLRKEAEMRGVDARRLIFAIRVPSIEEHLARYRLADIFLDTTPYNAHTTTSDVLRAGLPVLTCMGKAFAGRVAGSLLHAVGLPELVTNSLEEYENLALRLARSPDELTGIRKKLRENLVASPLYDTRTYCRNLEAAYQSMWKLYQRGEAPRHFSVADGV
jgi:predicted O-linked N-acetylglucosamine transferase (SPINDLY family)